MTAEKRRSCSITFLDCRRVLADPDGNLSSQLNRSLWHPKSQPLTQKMNRQTILTLADKKATKMNVYVDTLSIQCSLYQ